MKLFVALIFMALSAQAEVEPGQLCETENIMTLPWTICLLDHSKSEAELRAAMRLGFQEIHRIDEWMSEWKSESLISEINRQAGVKPVKVTQEAWDAIEVSLKHGRLTSGAFDITFNAFFGMYSWKPGHERFPSPAEIKRTLPLVNYKLVQMNPRAKTVFLPKKGMKIGLGGMGEGWAIDKVFDLLQPLKIRAGYIDASGGVRVWGVKPSGKLWTIGVGDPRPMNPSESRKGEIYKLYVTDVAVTTAGDTEKFFVRNGRRFHHIIDPKTGYSASRSIQVTSICKTATLCDLVDDGVYIMGGQRGASYAEAEGTEAVIVAPDRKVRLTRGLKAVETEWGRALQIDKPILLPRKL